MRKRTRTLLLTAAIMLLCIVSFAACTPNGDDYSAYAAKYYRYINDIKQANEWVELKADKSWTDNTTAGGTYEVTGENIKIFVELFGEKSELMSGTINDGTLTVTFLNVVTIYKKDVSNNGNGNGEGEELPEWMTNPSANHAEMKTRLETLGYEVEYGDAEYILSIETQLELPAESVITALTINDGWNGAGGSQFDIYYFTEATAQTAYDSLRSVLSGMIGENTTVRALTNKVGNIVMYKLDFFGDYVDDASGGLRYYINSKNNGYVVYPLPDSAVTSVIIPAVYNGLPVTWIRFEGNATVRNVTVQSVGVNGFGGCTALENVILTGVQTIESGTFMNCTSLTSIIIPASVTSIGDGAFRDCTSLPVINMRAANSGDMTLGDGWNGEASVVWDYAG
jgi:hypothetical protein